MPKKILAFSNGEKLGKIGKEFGATTGRPRRCGWFDAIAAKYSCMINGLTDIALTKLDILDVFDRIKIVQEKLLSEPYP